METTYKIIGGDGQEYGPITLEQIKSWSQEGRLAPETKVQRSDQAAWATAAQFPELGLAGQPAAAATVLSPAAAANMILEKRLRSGADWFFWIAGLSLVNSVLSLAGSNTSFVIGLGITQIIDAVAHEAGSGGKTVAIVLDLLAAGVLVMFGFFARRRQSWSFIVGMVLYALDGLIFLLVQNFLSVGFHAFALWCIFNGLKASRQLQKG